MQPPSSERLNVLQRNNVRIGGRGQSPMMFAHGFGCDQNMWRLVTPAFGDSHQIVVFDHVGAGRSDLAAYDRQKYANLNGYATDVLEICGQLGLSDVIFVGQYVHRHMPQSRLVVMEATGHCPNLSAPDETVAAIRRFVDALP